MEWRTNTGALCLKMNVVAVFVAIGFDVAVAAVQIAAVVAVVAVVAVAVIGLVDSIMGQCN